MKLYCKDYITEKFFVNGLGHDILPIAMGARLEDYQESAPHKSFLHVDQFSGPEHLASFLHKLDQDDSLYNEYFQVWYLDKTSANCHPPLRHCQLGHRFSSMHAVAFAVLLTQRIFYCLFSFSFAQFYQNLHNRNAADPCKM